MVFPVQFGINKHLQIFQTPNFVSRAYLFQIAHEIMWLPIQKVKDDIDALLSLN